MTTDNLAKVRRFYEQAVMSSAYQTWRSEALEAWRFYDGEQWSEDEIEALKNNGQPAIVINKIAPKIDNITGSEIAGRTRVIYRSRSDVEDEENTAKSLTDIALYVSERSEQALEISRVFKAGLVTGIGWLDVGVEAADEGPQVFNRYEDEQRVVFDPLSQRLDYSDARFVCRERWMDDEQLVLMFPEKGEELKRKLSDRTFGSVGGSAIAAPSFALKQPDMVDYVDGDNAMLRVVEVQYKVTEKQYVVETLNGQRFVTFEKDEAFKIPRAEVKTQYASRVYIAYFCDDVLLEHKPSPYMFSGFTLIPYIFKRNHDDNRPYGLVRTALDPQRELNKRRSKAMHLLNTAQVIADVDAVEDPQILAREAARPDGLILKRPGKELRILRNSDLAASQVAVMDAAARDIQDVMGVFDEAIGKHSNATSGTAIRQRQMASNQNQMFAFDALRRTKKSLGTAILALMRQFFSHEMVIHITDNFNASRLVRLNQPVQGLDGQPVRGKDGAILKVNDVNAGVFDVHVEEVRDVSSSRELELEELQMLMSSGVPVPPHLLVEATSVRKKQEILQALGQGQNQPSTAAPVPAKNEN